MSEAELREQVQGSDAETLIVLGDKAEKDGNHALARGHFANAAKAGNLSAQTRLAVSLLTLPPLSANEGVAMARDAAQRGDARAMHLCAVLAANDSRLPNRWRLATDYLKESYARGDARAVEDVALLTAESGGGSLESMLAIPAPRELSASPKVQVFEKFLPPSFCDRMIESAKTNIQPATVILPQTGDGQRMDHVRSNSHAGFNIGQWDMILSLTRSRIAAASGFVLEGLEWPAVLRYEVGEEYKPHFDFFDANAPALARDIAKQGQRVATFLIYLNDDFEGGETDFPRLNIRFRGNKGDGLMFFNVDENEKPDRRTLHAGLAPTRGEKWLFSQWIRKDLATVAP